MPLPRRRRVARPQLLPSRRSVLVGLAVLAAAGAGYAGARSSSAFAVTGVEVTGAPPAVRAQVAQTLGPLRGTSLLGLDGGRLVHEVEALPTVLSASYDRAFPHTLRVTVVPEAPVAVLRRGGRSWLLSARGRVVQPLSARAQAGLPRVWVPARTQIELGAFMAPDAGGTAARALALAQRFPARIAVATATGEELRFRLRSGLELRLGAPADVRLKLAIARRALALLPAGATYLDVSVPGRPVAGGPVQDNPQVSTGG